MSDPALTNQNQSYVDSYVPPTAGVTSPAPANIQTQTPTQNSTFDPLKKLEELVAEFEVKKDQKKSEQLADIKNLQQQAAEKVMPAVNPGSASAADPLAELEKALDEYEKKYKEKVAAAKQPQASVSAQVQPTVKPADDKVSLQDLKLAVDDFEQKNASKVVTAKHEVAADESIDEQNIFDLLGVNDATDQEKEAFLDELQQALWEDFLEKDLVLLVSEAELAEITKIKDDASLNAEQKQVKLIAKIEEFVPDIEEIMLEKALELKEDMVLERLDGLKQSFQQNNQDLTKLVEAEDYFKNGHWKTGAQILNALQ